MGEAGVPPPTRNINCSEPVLRAPSLGQLSPLHACDVINRN